MAKFGRNFGKPEDASPVTCTSGAQNRVANEKALLFSRRDVNYVDVSGLSFL